MKYEIKFEWIYLSVLTIGLFSMLYFGNQEMQTQVTQTIIGLVTLVAGYLFGKSNPDERK